MAITLTWLRAARAAVSLLPLLLGACDTLKARSLAQDGVEKYRNGDIKGAAELFEKAAQIEPDMPVIQLNRGYTHLSLFQLAPKSKEGARAATVAIDAFKRYLQLPIKPEQRQKARDYLLQTFADAQKYDEAVEWFKPLVEKNPPDIEALTILANIAKSVGKTVEARTWLEKRVQADPKDPDGYVALAIMDWEQLCNDSQCRIPPDKRQPMQMPPEQRLAIANHGIELCQRAAEIAPNAPTPLIYWNLLLRERQYGYVPTITDPKDPKFQEEQDRANKRKTDDLNQAAEIMKRAMEMQKSATGGAAKAGPPRAGAEAPKAPPAPSPPAVPAPPAAPEKN